MSLDLITFLGIIAVAFIIAGFTYYFAQRRAKLRDKDPLVYKIPNKTNYNLNQMDDESLEGLSAAEAKEVIRKEDQSITDSALSRDDFEQLKRATDGKN